MQLRERMNCSNICQQRSIVALLAQGLVRSLVALHLVTLTSNRFITAEVYLPFTLKLYPIGGQSQVQMPRLTVFFFIQSVRLKCWDVHGTISTKLRLDSQRPFIYSLQTIVMSKYLVLSLRLMPSSLMANMKGLSGGLMGMTVSLGSKSSSEVELQVMICMLRVWMAVLMKRATKMAITISEQMPPEAVLYSLSYWKRRNCEVEKRSKNLKNFVAVGNNFIMLVFTCYKTGLFMLDFQQKQLF